MEGAVERTDEVSAGGGAGDDIQDFEQQPAVSRRSCLQYGAFVILPGHGSRIADTDDARARALVYGTKAVAVSSNKPLTSKFRGVCWNKKNKRWQAAINSSGKYLYLGSYDTEEKAASVFDKAALRIRGIKARLNFSVSDYVDADGSLKHDPAIEDVLNDALKPGKPRRYRAGAGGAGADMADTPGGKGPQSWGSHPDGDASAEVAAPMAAAPGYKGGKRAGRLRRDADADDSSWSEGEDAQPRRQRRMAHQASVGSMRPPGVGAGGSQADGGNSSRRDPPAAAAEVAAMCLDNATVAAAGPMGANAIGGAMDKCTGAGTPTTEAARALDLAPVGNLALRGLQGAPELPPAHAAAAAGSGGGLQAHALGQLPQELSGWLVSDGSGLPPPLRQMPSVQLQSAADGAAPLQAPGVRPMQAAAAAQLQLQERQQMLQEARLQMQHTAQRWAGRGGGGGGIGGALSSDMGGQGDGGGSRAAAPSTDDELKELLASIAGGNSQLAQVVPQLLASMLRDSNGAGSGGQPARQLRQRTSQQGSELREDQGPGGDLFVDAISAPAGFNQHLHYLQQCEKQHCQPRSHSQQAQLDYGEQQYYKHQPWHRPFEQQEPKMGRASNQTIAEGQRARVLHSNLSSGADVKASVGRCGGRLQDVCGAAGPLSSPHALHLQAAGLGQSEYPVSIQPPHPELPLSGHQQLLLQLQRQHQELRLLQEAGGLRGAGAALREPQLQRMADEVQSRQSVAQPLQQQQSGPTRPQQGSYLHIQKHEQQGQKPKQQSQSPRVGECLPSGKDNNGDSAPEGDRRDAVQESPCKRRFDTAAVAPSGGSPRCSGGSAAAGGGNRGGGYGGGGGGDVFTQIQHALPRGAILDCLMPSTVPNVLGVLYRLSTAAGAGANGDGTCAAVWNGKLQRLRLLGTFGTEAQAKASCQAALAVLRDHEVAAAEAAAPVPARETTFAKFTSSAHPISFQVLGDGHVVAGNGGGELGSPGRRMPAGGSGNGRTSAAAAALPFALSEGNRGSAGVAELLRLACATMGVGSGVQAGAAASHGTGAERSLSVRLGGGSEDDGTSALYRMVLPSSAGSGAALANLSSLQQLLAASEAKANSAVAPIFPEPYPSSGLPRERIQPEQAEQSLNHNTTQAARNSNGGAGTQAHNRDAMLYLQSHFASGRSSGINRDGAIQSGRVGEGGGGSIGHMGGAGRSSRALALGHSYSGINASGLTAHADPFQSNGGRGFSGGEDASRSSAMTSLTNWGGAIAGLLAVAGAADGEVTDESAVTERRSVRQGSFSATPIGQGTDGGDGGGGGGRSGARSGRLYAGGGAGVGTFADSYGNMEGLYQGGGGCAMGMRQGSGGASQRHVDVRRASYGPHPEDAMMGVAVAGPPLRGARCGVEADAAYDRAPLLGAVGQGALRSEFTTLADVDVQEALQLLVQQPQRHLHQKR